MTLGKHMPYAQSSEKYHTLLKKKKTTNVLFSFSAKKKRFFMNLCSGLKLILMMSYLSQCIWSHVDLLGIHMLCVPKCVYTCISCIEPLFLVSAKLHNDESCRDLMTAVVDFMFFPEFG